MQNSQPKSRRALVLLGAGGLFLILLIAGLFYLPKAKQQWMAPLGPGLELPTHTPNQPTPSPTVEKAVLGLAAAAENSTEQAASTSVPTIAPTLSPTATQAPLCGGPAQMMVLGVGADSGVDYYYGLSDVMRIARIDFVNAKVSVISLPRDLWVELPGIVNSDGITITHSKLNQAYFYGGPGMGYYDGPGGGPGLLARTLDYNFGLQVDHYGAVNMSTFIRIIDAVGGVDIYLPEAVDGTPFDKHTPDMGFFGQGNHHLTGEEALKLSRIRKRYSDFARQDHQTLVLCALRKKLLTPAVLPKIPKIISAFQDNVLTDLSPQQISQLACLLPYIERENIIFSSLPDDLFESGRVSGPIQKKETFALHADFDVVRDYMQKFMAGEWPTQPEEPSCP